MRGYRNPSKKLFFANKVCPMREFSQPPTIYSDAIFEHLAQEFKIDPEFHAEVRTRLEGAGDVWKRLGGGTTDSLRPGEIKKELQQVSKQAGKLYDRLKALSLDANHALMQSHERIGQAAAPKDLEQGDLQYPFVAITEGDPSPVAIALQAKDLSKIISGIRDVAEAAIDDQKTGRAGKKSDDALRLWITNIETIWIDILGRPFSRDVTDAGDPISEAARFCVEAFKPIDAALPSSRVLNAMKTRIKATQQKPLEDL
ncbi:hypothetical protein DL1_15595 [Thioclava dalianensis]|uniref:Uncharacterized protein n=1 Tax=Thioclava dalianensis TaxID=1185766 RepID=A0A074TNZ4_9RHOB|nr:hypothetical protein [Thioclava dalianensis]KEP70708.1 hypothetical protein DL1_15595 [Thioclava dalianensis]